VVFRAVVFRAAVVGWRVVDGCGVERGVDSVLFRVEAERMEWKELECVELNELERSELGAEVGLLLLGRWHDTSLMVVT
jgi:hypothetical protein